MGLTTTVLASILLGMGQEGEKTKTFKDPATDLIFDYPQSWGMKTDKYATTFTFTVKNQSVLVRLLRTDQRYPAGHWQSSVKMVEETNKNEVLKQWEEELLGVPLLLTRYREQKGAVRSIVLVGLLYARTAEKMSFRLISPEPVADEAEAVWRNVLMSTRTVSGKLPEKEDITATIPVTTEEVKPETRPTKSFTLTAKSKADQKFFKGPVRITLDDQAGIYGYLPEGWKFENGTAKSDSAPFNLVLSSGVNDVDSAKKVWLVKCGQKMSELDSVGKRTEPPMKVSEAGFELRYMIRSGTKDGIEKAQVVVLGWSAGLYFIAEFDGSAEDWAKNRGAIEKVIGQISVSSS